VQKEYDYLIVGAGIVGLSIGVELLQRNPSLRVLIAEKETAPAQHASGRNSGVLHAGFYYSPDSLKARFCLEGNSALREIISESRLPINECGKVVVATCEEDLPRLHELYRRGLANGAKLELLEEDELNDFEPLAKTYRQFIWSPLTAVSDPVLVSERIRESYLKLGGELRTEAMIKIDLNYKVTINGVSLSAVQIINAAGTNAIHLAHSVGVGKKYAQLPVLGLYKVTPRANLPLKTLVYPVPNPKNPFLGVHFTLTVQGDIKIGPTAIPILGREQYSWQDLPEFLDLQSSIKALKSLMANSPANLINLARTELPKISTKVLSRDGQKLVPSANESISWKKKRPGIRAQLVNLEKGEFEMDFVVQKEHNIVHVLNAVSPGWTSAIPFAKWIVATYL
jgi:L-2-hydroxyglutarate oxidase LhgO